MLVLGRKEGESIRIAECVEIKILGLSGNRVKLGVQAPGDVRIVRGEIDVSGHNGRIVPRQQRVDSGSRVA